MSKNMKIDIDPANQIGSFRSFCITKFTTNRIIHRNSSNLAKIQQILDDYNEQIRNSPDLQNRPAPRRRTNGVPSTTASSVISYSTTTSNNTSSPVMSPISSSAMNGNNITTLAKKKRNISTLTSNFSPLSYFNSSEFKIS